MRRTLPISAAVFLALLAVTFVCVREEEPPAPAPFFTLQRRTPDTLVVAHAGDTTTLVPGGRGWKVVHPVRGEADALVVEAMLKRLAPLAVEAVYPLTPDKMDTYGFRFPRGWIRAAYREGLEPDTVWVGAFTLDGAYDYVRAGSAPVAGIVPSRESRAYLLKSTLELRDTRLLPFQPSLVTAFRIAGENGRIRLEAVREEGGRWALVRPESAAADPEQVREYLTSAAHMHVRSFVREEEGPRGAYGLAAPRRTLEIETGDGPGWALWLGDPIPGTDLVYAAVRGRPQVLGVSDKYIAFLSEPADAFRQPPAP